MNTAVAMGGDRGGYVSDIHVLRAGSDVWLKSHVKLPQAMLCRGDLHYRLEKFMLRGFIEKWLYAQIDNDGSERVRKYCDMQLCFDDFYC